MHPKDKAKLASIHGQKAIKMEGWFDYDETLSAIDDYLDNLEYDMSSKDLAESHHKPNRSYQIYRDGYRFYTDYFKFHISFKLNLDGKEQETEDENGNKVTMCYGKGSIILNSYIHSAYNVDKTNLWNKFFYGLFGHFYGRDKFSDAIVAISGDVNGLFDVLKKQFKSKI